MDGHGIVHGNACWFADGKHILFSGTEGNHGVRLYVQDTTNSKVEAITSEGINALAFALSPDGREVAAVGPDDKAYLFPIPSGDPRLIKGFEPGEVPVAWGSDSGSLFVYRSGDLPAKVFKLEIASGKRTPWKQLMPPDPAGVEFVGPVLPTPDGKAYAYGYRRLLSDLYLVEGLK